MLQRYRALPSHFRLAQTLLLLTSLAALSTAPAYGDVTEPLAPPPPPASQGPAPNTALPNVDSHRDENSVDFTPPDARIPHSPETLRHIQASLDELSRVPTLSQNERSMIDAELARVIQNEAFPRIQKSRMTAKGTKHTSSDGIIQSPPRKSLAVTHQTQMNFYYCGPATASMIVNYKGKKISQKTLASSRHLRTDSNKATYWRSRLMAPTLNKLIGTKEYQNIQSPSLAVLKGSFLHDIGRLNLPIALDTYEAPNGPHYNNHPRNKKIGHWIVGYGYNDYGNILHFYDPASPTIFKKSAKSFAEKATTFYKFLDANGIVA